MFNEVEDTSVQLSILNIVCLCCKESVNRVKVRNFGGLKILCSTLSDDKYHKMHDRIISALQCFVFDEAGLNVLLEQNLVPILMQHLQRVAGFVSSTVNFQDYFSDKKLESTLPAFSPGIFQRFYQQLVHKQESFDCEQVSDTSKNVFSIDSPTYEPKSDWNMEEYRSGAKCKEIFEFRDVGSTSPASMSPLSTVSFYSPSLSPASDFSPPSSPGDRASSGVNNDPSYPFVCSLSYKTDASSPGGYSPGKGEGSVVEQGEYSESEDEEKEESLDTLMGKIDDEKAEDTSSEIKQVPKVNLFKQKRQAADMSDDEEMMESSSKKRKVVAFEETVVQGPPFTKKKRNGSCSTEQHILMVLSRISQMDDPSRYLMNVETICCCLDYLALVDKPEKRMARTVCRMISNPLCLKGLLDIHMPLLIYHKLLKNTEISYTDKILKCFLKSKHEILKNKEWNEMRSRSNSVDSTSSQFSFLDIDDSWSYDCSDRNSENQQNQDLTTGKSKTPVTSPNVTCLQKQNTEHSSASHESAREFEDLSFPFRAGLILLQDVSRVIDGPYGRGELAHCFHKMNPDIRNMTLFSLLFALW